MALPSTIQVTVGRTSNQKIVVSKSGAGLSSETPLVFHNQSTEVRGIDNIPDVNAAAKADGSTLVYNANTQKYDVKMLNVNEVAGIIDEGEF